MRKPFVLLTFAGIVVAVGVWAILERYGGRPDGSDTASPPPPAEPATIPTPSPLSALPDAEAARVRTIREAITAGEKQDYRFRELVERAAHQLTDEELIAALEITVDPNYAIESLCADENFALERRVALVSHFVALEDAEGMPDAIAATAYLFAQKDPAATRQWLHRFKPGIGSGQGLGYVFDHLDKTDPAASVAMLCDLDDREAEAIIGYGNGPNLKHLSGREFLALVGTFTSERLREFHLRQTVVWHLAEDDPEGALRYVRELPPEERHATHGRHLVQMWARQEGANFPAIVDRLESDLPEELRSPQTHYVLAEAWYGRSPAAARRWIDQLNLGPSRDEAIAGYVRDPKEEDTADAYALTLTMSDPEKRRAHAGWALLKWARADPDSARAVLPDADINKSARQAVESTLKASE